MNPQYISLAYADRLIEFKVDPPSVSTVRDSSDNTLAEASGTASVICHGEGTAVS